tara:strand:- start:2757 stop:3107 length:351 start_codon:yes stop_codon:yes gene_type:complete
MATKLFSGYERTNRVRLPENKVKLDVSNPIGASTMATVIKAQKTGDYENVGNALALHDAVDMTMASSEPVKIGEQEVTTLVDADSNEQNTTDPSMVSVLMKAGWKILKIEREDIFS